MAFFDIVLPTDTIEVSDSIVQERILSDVAEVTDAIAVSLINTLSITNARALTDRKVRIDFTTPALVNSALSNPANYTFVTSTPGAVEIIPMSIDLPPGQVNPSFVEVNVTEHTDGAIYQVSISPLIVGPGGETGGGAAKSYAGKGTSPQVTLVLAMSPTEAVVYFDEPILDNPAANDVANYVWDNGLSTVAVIEVVGNTVTLQTTPQTPLELYNLTVRGILAVVINDAIQVTDSEPQIGLIDVYINDSIGVSDSVTPEVTSLPAFAVLADGVLVTADGAPVTSTP